MGNDGTRSKVGELVRDKRAAANKDSGFSTL